MYCTNCGTKNPENANFCLKCGNSLTLSNNQHSISLINSLDDNKSAVKKNINTINTATVKNEDNVSRVAKGVLGGLMAYYIVLPEIVILSIIIGILFHSWLLFGLTLAVSIVIYNNHKLAWILIILLSLVWGIIGYGVGSIFGSESGEIVLGIIGFLLGLGVHASVLDFYDLLK